MNSTAQKSTSYDHDDAQEQDSEDGKRLSALASLKKMNWDDFTEFAIRATLADRFGFRQEDEGGNIIIDDDTRISFSLDSVGVNRRDAKTGGFVDCEGAANIGELIYDAIENELRQTLAI